MIDFNKCWRPKDDGCNKRQDGNCQSSPSNDKQIDNVKISGHGSSLKTQHEMNTLPSCKPHVCIITYSGDLKSLSYIHEKQVPYHAFKHTMSLKTKGATYISDVFLCPPGSCYHRGIHETVLSGLCFSAGNDRLSRGKIENNNNELMSLKLKMKTIHGAQIVFATHCLLWMHSLIISHCWGNQATTSPSQSFKVSVHPKCCHEVAVVLLSDKSFCIVEEADINTVHLAVEESKFSKSIEQQLIPVFFSFIIMGVRCKVCRCSWT